MKRATVKASISRRNLAKVMIVALAITGVSMAHAKDGTNSGGGGTSLDNQLNFPRLIKPTV